MAIFTKKKSTFIQKKPWYREWSEALIVDTRFNGGGWLHDDLVTFLTGRNYVDLYPRSDEAPGLRYFGEPARR